MKRDERSTKGRQLMLAVLLTIATVVASLAPIADARTTSAPTRVSQTMEEGTPNPGGDTNRWWGVAGAVLCGLEIRMIVRVPAIGMNPYALAAGIAGCTLALLDVMTTQ